MNRIPKNPDSKTSIIVGPKNRDATALIKCDDILRFWRISAYNTTHRVGLYSDTVGPIRDSARASAISTDKVAHYHSSCRSTSQVKCTGCDAPELVTF